MFLSDTDNNTTVTDTQNAATTEVPAVENPVPTSSDTQFPSLGIIIVLGVLAGIVVAFLKHKKQKTAQLPIFTFEDAYRYAEKMQISHPEIVSMLISFIVNDKTNKKMVAQNMLDKEGTIIKINDDELLGRMVPVMGICPKLTELIGDDCKCTIVLQKSGN